MRRSLFVFVAAAVVGTAAPVMAQTCTPGAGALAINPRTISAVLEQFDRVLVGGGDAIPAYELGFFEEGAAAPFWVAGQIPKAEWTLVSGATYRANLPPLTPSVPVGQTRYAALRAIGEPSIGNSAWSACSNPLASEPPPGVPGQPTAGG